MIAWRIFYDDGSTYSSEDGLPESAPGRGVVCVVQKHESVGREILSRKDYFYWHEHDGRWWDGDLLGLIDQLTADRMGYIKAVKQGRMVSDDRWVELYDSAVSDPDFPTKSAGLPGGR